MLPRVTNDRAVLFNIQKYSLADGPGIRTTFFFKGCSLWCKWCSNPESQSMEIEVAFEGRGCIGCGKCFSNCPVMAIYLGEHISIDRKKCVRCFKCAENCPTGAMVCYGKEYTIDELIEIARKDVSFYRNSGGGVTLSGGEPLLNPEFAELLLAACKEEGFNTAIETCGAVSWSAIESVSYLIDTFYFDLKHVDREKLEENTGADTVTILTNLKQLVRIREVIIRYPFIPYFNSSHKDVTSIAEWISENATQSRVELLPYHRFGEKKYESLGRVYKMSGAAVPDDRLIESAIDIFKTFGISCNRIH
jgi:pyruvate formate lyase activating enzyme